MKPKKNETKPKYSIHVTKPKPNKTFANRINLTRDIWSENHVKSSCEIICNFASQVNLVLRMLVQGKIIKSNKKLI